MLIPSMRLQGCVGVMKSFFMQFHAMSGTVDRGEIIKPLIEAICTSLNTLSSSNDSQF